MKCNMCGKEILMENDLPKEDYVYIRKDWGYFSQKDGETHEIILCEKCYDSFCGALPVPASVSDTRELL